VVTSLLVIWIVVVISHDSDDCIDEMKMLIIYSEEMQNIILTALNNKI
jgi:hypothetical protein